MAMTNEAKWTLSQTIRKRGTRLIEDPVVATRRGSGAISTPSGREALRTRVQIGHRLSHHARKQGPRARDLGVRNNVFDSRRRAATINLENLQLAEAA